MTQKRMKVKNGNEEYDVDFQDTDVLLIIGPDGGIKECYMPKDCETTRGMQIAYTLLMARPPNPTEASKELNKKVSDLINFAADSHNIDDHAIENKND